ncbi:MAG: hypothetical protein HQL54_11605 [Magnetococcales bacterium]|nr:hypothetical protein [Magnetococcales bacterium]
MGLSAIFSLPFSFRHQLFVIVTMVIVGVTLITSVTSAWFASERLRTLQVNEGLQITDSLARQSVLAILYNSASNVEEAVTATLSFSAISHVGIFDREHQPILERSINQALQPVSEAGFTWPMSEASLVREGDDDWHFVAPVFLDSRSQDEEPVFLKDAGGRELLGHVHVQMSKELMHTVQWGIFRNSILIALLFIFLSLFLLHGVLLRLLKPLNKLADLMKRTETNHAVEYASTEGPSEVVEIAQVYNRMMEALEERDRLLREHNERLEHLVEKRTEDLVEARDLALASSRHKSEFLANMTHELRTPLQSVIGYTDFAMETLLDEGMDECVPDLEKVLNNAHKLLKLINEVLDFSKIEAGRMQLFLEPVAVPGIVQQALDSVMPVLKLNGNRLETQLPQQMKTVMLDGGKLQQILVNLLANAAKFTQNGLVTLVVSHNKGRLIFQVLDTGIGMEPEQIGSIFDPFIQADGSFTRKFQGSGLGLAISQRFCQLMNGDISVKSTPGKGSCFTVSLPELEAKAQPSSSFQP